MLFSRLAPLLSFSLRPSSSRSSSLRFAMLRLSSLRPSFGRFGPALLLALATVLARPEPLRAEIGSYLLFDMADGRILAAHEPTALWYPASITKLMTAYATFQAVERGEIKLTSPVTISPQANQQPPSRMGFPVGTVLTVETALRILMTKSANDVAFALAEAVGGTLAGFIDRMNAAAAEIGMTASFYDNPHGLPNEKQVTTARDIALLMMALAEDFPERADFFSMNAVRLGSRNIVNHNALLRQVPGADGFKTGFICASGFNVAASATRNGRRLGAVVLGGLTTRERNERTAELLEKGFRALTEGGSVALDGFDEPDGRLDLRPVSGTTLTLGTVEDLGTVSGLVNPADAEAVDRRAEVCGARRPITRYSDGTVGSVAEVEAQRAKVAAYRLKAAARESLRAEVLSAPRPAPVVFAAPGELSAAAPRRLADAAFIPAGWSPAADGSLPPLHPSRPLAASSDPIADAAAPHPTQAGTVVADASGPSTPLAATAPAGAAPSGSSDPDRLAPAGWLPSPAFPIPNPLEDADLRSAPTPPDAELPLTYLGATIPLNPFPIALGGADTERPEPLSGTIVGGGRAPIPLLRPLRETTPTEGETDRQGNTG